MRLGRGNPLSWAFFFFFFPSMSTPGHCPVLTDPLFDNLAHGVVLLNLLRTSTGIGGLSTNIEGVTVSVSPFSHSMESLA